MVKRVWPSLGVGADHQSNSIVSSVVAHNLRTTLAERKATHQGHRINSMPLDHRGSLTTDRLHKMALIESFKDHSKIKVLQRKEYLARVSLM